MKPCIRSLEFVSALTSVLPSLYRGACSFILYRTLHYSVITNRGYSPTSCAGLGVPPLVFPPVAPPRIMSIIMSCHRQWKGASNKLEQHGAGRCMRAKCFWKRVGRRLCCGADSVGTQFVLFSFSLLLKTASYSHIVQTLACLNYGLYQEHTA